MDNSSNFSLKKWLLNPAEFTAGGTSLIIGLVVMILTAVAGHFVNANFDGPIDLHIGAGKNTSMAFHIFEPIFSWFVFSLLLYISGQIISNSAIRIIDVFGTQALSRIAMVPMVPLSYLAMKPLENSDLLKRITAQNFAFSSSDMSSLIIVALLSIPVIFFVVWTIMWMYRAYSISCNTKGGKAIAAFIIVILVAEIITKPSLIMLAKYF